MGRNKIDPSKKKVRLDLYVEQETKDLIKKNDLISEIDRSINEICKEHLTQKPL